VEGGPRVASFVTNSAREVAGVKGDFADAQNAWTYNVYAQHSTVDTQFGNLNYLSNPLLQQALNVLPSATGPVCGGPNNRLATGPLVTPGTAFTTNSACVPWNVWKPNGVTQQALNFMTVPEQAQGTVTEYVADASVTGDLGKYGVKLPFADTGMQLNIGTEWREDSSNFAPDYVSQQGYAAGGGGATPPVVGEFSVWEVFTEMRLPIAQHQFLADDLSFEGGYRYSKYSEGFSTDTYKLGLDWAPIHDVRLRGSYQRAVRAPNIGELFTPQAVGLDGSIDPCSTATPSASLAACEKSGVKPSQYGHIGPNPANQYNGLLGGNPNLKPETADTYTFGVLLQPTMVPNLTLSADYFNIKITDVIGAIGANTILLDCLTSGQFCNLVHRDNNGSLWLTPNGFIKDTTVNQGELRTSGVDAKGSYRQGLPGLGSLLFSLEGTYLKNLTTTPVAGGTSYDCKGFFGANCGGGNPSWRSVFNATWSTPWDGLDVNLRWRYYGSNKSQQLSTSPLLAGSPFLPTSHIPAYSWFDLSASFNIYKTVRMTLGVNNIADKIPPIVTGGDCSTSSGGFNAGANCNGNTFPGVYDAMGRYLFANISAQF